MGSRIAAHFANAGIPSLLLDLTADAARKGVEAAVTQKPGAFFIDSARALIAPGSFDEHLPQTAECDWIIEAVTENLEIKRALWKRVEACRARGCNSVDQYQRHSAAPDRGGFFRRLPPPFPGHAFLQSATVFAPVGGDSRPRDRSGAARLRIRIRRSPPGQGSGAVQGHAQLHRQPHWFFPAGHDRQDRRGGWVHGGGGGRAHRASDRPAQERDIPIAGYRRAGCGGICRRESVSRPSRRPLARALPVAGVS